VLEEVKRLQHFFCALKLGCATLRCENRGFSVQSNIIIDILDKISKKEKTNPPPVRIGKV